VFIQLGPEQFVHVKFPELICDLILLDNSAEEVKLALKIGKANLNRKVMIVIYFLLDTQSKNGHNAAADWFSFWLLQSEICSAGCCRQQNHSSFWPDSLQVLLGSTNHRRQPRICVRPLVGNIWAQI
jgi:hypothetical protein